MVKRLFAVGAGATMLGATAMGALAADLSTYPNMFVKDGTFNGWFVVGENAAAIDNLAMTDIAASMKYLKAGDTSSTTVEGDAWLVGTSSKKLEMANSNASGTSVVSESFRDINTFISDDELSALSDGNWATNEADYGFQQYLYFDNTPASVSPGSSRIVKYAENDEDVTADFFFVPSGGQIARYYLEFTSTAQSDITDSAGTADTTGGYLDDFEDTTLNLMGKEYTVVQARRPVVPGGVKLLLMSGSTSDTLLEGETKTYDVGEKSYEVTLSFVDADEAKFTINGEATNKLKDGDTYVLADKSEVGVSEILYQDYAGGVHSATFFLGARKLELRDDGINSTLAGAGSHQLRVGSEDIEGADVIIQGSDDYTTFTITSISLNITAEDDYFVGSGQKLSEVITASGDEKEMLFDGGFDVEYKGLSDEKNHDLKLSSSTSRRYKLTVFDADGNAVSIPLAYASAGTNGNVTLGEEAYSGLRTNQKRLVLKEGESILKDDYFVVTSSSAISAGAANTDGSGKSYLLQYSGSDRTTKTSPKIRFKNLGSGETLEYSEALSNGTVATIKLGGFSFDVVRHSEDQDDDFNITVDLNGNGYVMDAFANTTNGNAVGSGSVTFVDYYGGEVGFSWRNDHLHNDTNNGNVSGSGNSSLIPFIGVNFTVPDGNDFDNVVPTNVVFNITGTSDPELRASTPSGFTLVTPEGETEVSYGYTSMGAFLKFNQPSGDPDEFTLTYPEHQRLPQVYITSGATTSSTTSGGSLVAVEVVDATKLDSEVADVTAPNVVAVGGPCVNTVAAELLGNPATCTEGFTPGKARVKLFEHANGNVAMLVAGYSGADTRLAGKVVAHRASDLSGMEVEVSGTSYTDAVVSAPSVATTTTTDTTTE